MLVDLAVGVMVLGLFWIVIAALLAIYTQPSIDPEEMRRIDALDRVAREIDQEQKQVSYRTLETGVIGPDSVGAHAN